MNRDEILNRVTEIFRDVFDDDTIELTEETTAADIEDWDSLSHLTLISAVEDAFHYKFSMKDVLGMENVGAMLTILENRK